MMLMAHHVLPLSAFIYVEVQVCFKSFNLIFFIMALVLQILLDVHGFLYCCLEGQVIKAWDIGVCSMQKGEVCLLMCKPEYAYGSVGSPPKIPPNSTLLFEVGSLYK